MARSSLLFFVCLAVFTLVQIGNTLKCYHCLDYAGGECDHPEGNERFIKTCGNDTNEVCVTENTTLLIGGQLIRGCAKSTVCDLPTKASRINITCTTCEGDLCNSSSNLTPMTFIYSVAFLIFTKIFVI